MELKQYQLDTLKPLRSFLELCRIMSPSDAYKRVTSEPEQAKRLGSYGGTYRAINNMPNVPHCCLRLPTGGGKTILAAHAIKVAQESLIEKDYPVVLWLVTSNTIRTQTVEALKRPGHPYRAVLDDAFQGRVRVFDITEFENVRPTDLRDSVAVIVSTIQTLRVNSTEGRKVYAHHEALEPHFSSVPGKIPGLEIIEEGLPGAGSIKFSFANLLHLHNPLMIVDEAHNAVTGLSREVQERVNPCAIIEFTATPKERNNTIHNVRASELKDAEMIKLPIVLGEHPSWQQAVAATIADRKNLEEEARGERDYIRPIALFQAEAEGNEVTVDALETYLKEVEGIAANQIAVATGDQRELDGIDLFSPKEPAIRYIITKQALKEGWDCSFAYVFCSVANVSSATDVEQLLGRVMRMPYATKRKSERLNRAYAHVPETKFGAAAASLRDKLVTGMGFEEQEAEDSIENAKQDMFGGEGFFKRSSRPTPKLDVTVKTLQPVAQVSEELAREGVRVTEQDGGEIRIEAMRPLSPKASELLSTIVPSNDTSFTAKAKEFALECAKLLSPAEQGLKFKMPALFAAAQGEMVLVDYETILDNFDWSIRNIPARLEKHEFEATEDGFNWEIDLDGETVRWKQADEQKALPMVAPVIEWTAEQLSIWLDRENRDPAFSQVDMLTWTSDLVQYLANQRNLPISLLHRLKFLISRKVREKVTQARKQAREKAHQTMLFDKHAHVELSFDNGFEFRENMFFGTPSYRGRFTFSKHFLGADQVGAFDGKDDGEEFQCAQALDSLKQVKHWVRNMDRHANAFKLPLANGNFYPDFVAELHDGRLFVVEYKGELTAAVAQSRRSIGELWERTSGGKCLFVIVEKEKDGMDMRGQLLKRLMQA
jgi:type III restriction enzyme